MNSIENFNLFGEQTDLPDVVHCETIEARALTHDWEFKPHRHARMHQFLMIETGSGHVRIEEHRFELTSGDVVNMPAGIVHGFQFMPGTHGWVVTLASELLEDQLRDTEGLRILLSKAQVLKSSMRIRRIFQSIFAEYPTRDFARAHVLRALSSLLAGLVARTLAENIPTEIRPDSSLQRRFEALLEDHFSTHLGVADYARLLSVTPTHLSRVMRQTTGLSTSAAIEARIIQEARRHLAFSNLQVSEVGYQLGYNDPAYFSRVFARATGQSPRAFRQGLEI